VSQPIDTASVAIVPDFSGFSRQLKAGIDTALRQMVGEVDRAFEQVERAAGEAGRDVGHELQRGGEVAERALREVSATANREMAQVSAASAAAGASVRGRLGGALSFAALALGGVALAAGAGLAAMTGFGLKSAAAIEQTTIGLEALTGSAETAKSFLAELQAFAASTPFEFAGVADASRRILAFGTSVGIVREEVIPTLTVIGDLVSVLGGTQQNVDSVVRALSQMASKGKLSQEEILQLAEALPGFNANAALAAQLGIPVADVLDLISAGGVDATTGINALLAGMAQFPGAAGAMAAQAQTLMGVFSTFKDTISIALSNAFQPVIPEIKSALSDLTPVLGDAIGQLAPSLGNLLSGLLPLVGQLVQGIVPILTPILDALGPALEQMGPSLVPLGEALGQLVVALVPVLPLFAEFLGVLAQLAIPLLKLLAAVLMPLTPVLNFMARAIGEVGKALAMIDWTAVGAAIANFFVVAWQKVSGFFVGIFNFFTELSAKTNETWQRFTNVIATRIAEVIIFVKSLPGKILETLGNLGALLVNAGKNLVQGLWNGISSLGGWLYSKVKSFVLDNTLGAAKKLLGISSPSKVFADEVGAMIPAGIEQGAMAGISDLQQLLSPIVPSGGTGTSGGNVTNLGGLGNVIVNITFAGVVPTEGEARRTGAAAGAGIASELQRRLVGLAVRTA